MYKELSDILWLMEEKAKVTGQYAFIDPIIRHDIIQWPCETVKQVHEMIRNKSILWRDRRPHPRVLSHDGDLCPYCVHSRVTRVDHCSRCFWGRRFGECSAYSYSLYQTIVSKRCGQSQIFCDVHNITSRLDMMKIYRRFNVPGHTGI